MIRVAKMLENAGMDAIEMSGGTFESGKFSPSRKGTAKSEDREVYYKKAAKAFKREIHIPLILVGGFLSFRSAKEAVDSGLADYIALSRPLIREPHLVRRWKNEDRTKATCISCNKYFSPLAIDEALHCPVEKKEVLKRQSASKR